MTKTSFVALLCCLFCISSYAQVSPGQLTAQELRVLGISKSSLNQLKPIDTGQTASPEMNAGLTITKVFFANAAKNRQLWRVDFAANYPTDNSNVIFYIDTDNNPQTGRKDVFGTDLMVWVENGKARTALFESNGTDHAGPDAFVVVKGKQLYLSVDIDLHQQDQKTLFGMMVLSQTNTPLERVDGTTFIAVDAPAQSTTAKSPRTGTANDLSEAPVLKAPVSSFAKTGDHLNGWTVLNKDSSTSTWAIDAASTALHIDKTNVLGSTELQSNQIAVLPKKQYLVSAQLNTKLLSAANAYLSISQFEARSDNPSIVLTNAVRPLYGTNGKWQNLSFYFITADNVDRVKINVVFAQSPINILVKDIQLKRIDPDAYKPRYEPSLLETLFPSADVEKVLSSRTRATAEVRKAGKRPRLFVDGKETVPIFYKAPDPWKIERSQFGDFSRAGVHVYFLQYYLGRGIYQTKTTGSWISKDTTDFSDLDGLMWHILRADPQAYIMLDLVTDPYPAWGEEHPDDVVTNEKGQKAIVDMHDLRWGGTPEKTTGPYSERYGQSYVSAQLRQDTTKVLLQLDQHIKESLPGKAVIGYYLNGGDDAQMFYWGERSQQLTDYSKAAVTAWRNWLKVRYGDSATLQKAWKRNDVTFETAEVPLAERRLNNAFFIDPKTKQDVIDYNRFHSEGTVDTRNIYAEALRKAHGTPIIIGGYYAGPTVSIPSQRATGYQLKSGQLDLITSVSGYSATRLPGGPGKAHQAWGSLSLHDSIGVAELDFRSWKGIPEGSPISDYQFAARVETAEESNAMIRRDTGHTLADGQGAWFFDMNDGWFNDPSIMRAVKESTDAYKKDFADNSALRADVAVFVDEYSLDCINQQNAWTSQDALSEQIRQMNSSGVPYHLYLQSDIGNPNLPQYKLYIFLNAYHLSKDQLQAIQELRRSNKVLCFMHAPGVVSEELLNASDAASAISEVTGIRVADNNSQDLLLQSTPKSAFGGNGPVSYSTSGFTYNHDQSRVPFAAPTFTVTDPKATPLAVYQSNGKTAVAMRDFDTWKSVFYGGFGIDAFFFNALSREANAWVATAPGSAVYANQHFLTIHALSPGGKKVQLLEPSKVTDLVDGKLLSAKTAALNLDMKLGETRWFYLQKP